MKTFVIYFSATVTVLLLALGSLRLHPYYHLAKKQGMIKETMTRITSDTLKIAFIGDSWAAYHHNCDSNMESMLSDKGLPAHVVSIGNVGAKSKDIYLRLYSTTKPVLLELPDYCIVSAGINDAVAKMGKEFYVYHYLLILQHLMDMGIRPVVLEMPDVHYRAIFGREPWTMKARHVLSSLLTGAEMYRFDSYRTSLKKAIRQHGLQDRLVYISADAWSAGGYLAHGDMYQSDETHLNAKGYETLDSCLASAIISDRRNNH